MLSRDEIIELFSNANRKLFLGEDIYNKCVRDGNKVSRLDLQKRLDFWKNNYDLSHIFKNCAVEDVVKICNFSPEKPVDDIVENKCYNDIKRNVSIGGLEEASVCSICYEYNKNGELPNKIGCGHYFHYSCLNDWVSRGNDTCPTCRKKITMLLGFPTQSNTELFKEIQKLDRDFTKNYLEEMKLFITKDEIKAFREIHSLKLEEGNVKDNLLMFLILLFIQFMIAKGTAYISTTIDPEYVPFIDRPQDENDFIASNNMLENIVIVPSSLYIGYQFILLMLTVFGSVLKKLS